MHTQQLNTTEATNKFFAIVDVERKNLRYRSTYTSGERAIAQIATDLLDSAYDSEIFINYRAKFIAIKVNKAIVKDQQLLNKVEGLFEEHNYTKLVSTQGIIYRIPRK